MHFATGMTNHLYGYYAVHWYWGHEQPEKSYVGPDEGKLIHDLRYWNSANTDNVLYWLKSYREFGGVSLIGSDEFQKIFLGGTPCANQELSVSWPKGGGTDVARWIEYADDKSLKGRIYSFDTDERTLNGSFLPADKREILGCLCTRSEQRW